MPIAIAVPAQETVVSRGRAVLLRVPTTFTGYLPVCLIFGEKKIPAKTSICRGVIIIWDLMVIHAFCHVATGASIPVHLIAS